MLTRLAVFTLSLGLASAWSMSLRAEGQDSVRRGADTRADAKHTLRPADSDSPLPEGWPDATIPGKIEVKDYPAYRSAVAKAKGASTRSDGVLFFSLFNHIRRNKIEMTAPVVNTYATPAMIETLGGTGEMTMEFLYRNTRQGEPGKGVGAVTVKDHPAQSFVCLGLEGTMDATTLRDAQSKLRKWLDENKNTWCEDGPPRRLGYHGPMTPVSQRRWEMQVPIKPVANAKVGARDATGGSPADRNR
jgi:hypothetical protein